MSIQAIESIESAKDQPPIRLSLEEFLNLPEEANVSRELINGVLIEQPMNTRTPKHSLVMGRLATFLNNWNDQHSGGRFDIPVGDVRCRLGGEVDNVVGIDLAVFTPDVADRLEEDERFYNGSPLVAVEIVSPSDTHESLVDKLHRYLDADVKQVWIVDPDLQTVTVHCRDVDPVLFGSRQEFTGEPVLPNFRVSVQSLFQRIQRS